MEIDPGTVRSLMEDRGFTQTALAEASGISRATLALLLGERIRSVHAGTARKLAEALGVDPVALDKQGTETAYMQAEARQHESLEFTRLGVIDVGDPLSMDDGFIAIQVREPLSERRGTAACEGDADDQSGVGPAGDIVRESFPLSKALNRSRTFFLLGELGGGKTTILRQLARTYALKRQRESKYPPGPLVPVFVRLADWAEQLRRNSQVGLLDAALAQLGVSDRPDTKGWLESQAKQGKAFLLLDGLDEVADPDGRGLLIEAICSSLASYADARCIITSRSVGFDRPSLGRDAAVYEMDSLTEEAMRQFFEAWCAHRHHHKPNRKCKECDGRREQLREAVVDHSRVRALAGNPMMLTILLLLSDAGVTLPQRRWELYEKIAEAFLFAWQEKKRKAIASSPDHGLRLDDRELVWVLESIAIEMQRQDWTLVSRWWLAEHCTRFLRDELHIPAEQAGAESDSLIWSLQQRAGLLIERGPERFGFLHLAFQEYFAARAVLAADDPIASLQPYLYHPRWREVVRLAAAGLDRRRAPKLLRLILDDPDPTGRFLRRGPLLALECLADGAAVRDRQLLEQAENQVADLGKAGRLRLTSETARLLTCLHETRLKALADHAARSLTAGPEGKAPSACAIDSETVQDALRAAMKDAGKNVTVRAGWFQAAEELLPKTPQAINLLVNWLAVPDDPLRRTAAACILARWAATERVDWLSLPIERIEHILVSVVEPCQHILDALQSLLDARERRRLGIPRETRIKRALEDLLPRIQAMFIFGSSARGEQKADSDIDLMVIGDVTLKDLTPGLRQAEQELGRQINVVIYSADGWKTRYRAGDSFVRQVARGEKAFIVGGSDELAAMVG